MEDTVTELRAKIAATQQELAEVTRERDDYKQAVYDLGLTPEEARAGAKRSRDMKQQLLATHAKLLESELHAARLGEALRAENFAADGWANAFYNAFQHVKNLRDGITSDFGGIVANLNECSEQAQADWKSEETHATLSTPINLDALHELQEENARLREALAKGRKDAERYQWLKENCALGIKQDGIGWSLNTRQCIAPDCMKELDASIDAARKEQK